MTIQARIWVRRPQNAVKAGLALLLSRFDFRGKGTLTSLAILPLLVPYFVLAVALLILFRVIGIPLGLPTIAIGHAVVALPYTTLMVLARGRTRGRHFPTSSGNGS